ncbi:tetratricopeptide repeat protein [Mucilaginibacter lappiensis]|uniref:Tfp pilus assembly protein PilF n=1 Tax=Mucilaginibacter lappiensis TaxID=354630 RepID=A0A841JC55_9SPHI|nr:tetratricopeptide repeat protein [Mucilaginibacter lappiensis]MBB6128370.1 Tfp pilus assembly protein PilF [Mucilaginibacter lappiensis]
MFNNDSTTNIQNIKNDVESGQYDYNKGTQQMNSRNFPEAEKHFLEALKYKDHLSKETYVNTLVNLGICCVNQEKPDQAKEYWQQAADLGDKDAANNLKVLNERLKHK